MHAYATNARDREFVPKVLAALAVAVTLTLQGTLSALNLTPPWWADAPSVMGIYGGLWALYDRWLWRQHIGSVALSQIPDIRGTWAGEVRSSYNLGTSTEVVLVVSQTWSKLSVRLLSEHSRSRSESATLNTADATPEGLTYTYMNEPNTFSAETMHAHRGSAWLRLAREGAGLEGEYFTGRDRQNIGDMQLTRVSRTAIDRSEALRRLADTRVGVSLSPLTPPVGESE